MSAPMIRTILRDAHDLDELSSRKIETASRCEVFRIASDPERIKPEAAG